MISKISLLDINYQCPKNPCLGLGGGLPLSLFRRSPCLAGWPFSVTDGVLRSFLFLKLFFHVLIMRNICLAIF